MGTHIGNVPQIFDTRLRRLRRARAAARFASFDFLARTAAAEIEERLSVTPRTFERAVWVGAVPPAGGLACIRGDTVSAFAGAGGVVFDEERLAFREKTLDLYVSVLSLHAANDLPGALAQIRRALAPGAMFMAALFGGRTLEQLRTAMAEAEIEVDGGLSPRVFPFADVRDAGALLQRAGFAQPIADADVLSVRYEHPLKLMADLRGMGETNILAERRRQFLKRRTLRRACDIYAAKFADGEGRVAATFELLYLTGRAP
jgi:SAM-dependent methyltransferase